MPDRNRVRFESNERVDKPDIEALQLGVHIALRYAVRGLLLGTDAGSAVAVTSRWTLTTLGTVLTVTPGRAVVGETMADASVEGGHIVGEDGDPSQSIDFNGDPANTYGIWVRADFSAGVSGSRIFWNAVTETEDAAAIDTREVSGWRVVRATSSPGAGYAQVGAVVWNGAAFTSTSSAGLHAYEGLLSAAGAETGNQWGDGANDRNADRATYGVQSLFKGLALVRRQLKDMIGAVGGHWGSTVPVSLTATKTHVDTTTDPHGSAPTWTGEPTFNGGMDVNGAIDATGAGYVEVDDKTDLRFASTQTGFYTIHGFCCTGFITNAATFVILGDGDGDNGRLNNDGTGEMLLNIPLHVPEGATIVKVSAVTYFENQTGATATATLRVIRNYRPLLVYINAFIGTATQDDTSVSGSGAAYGVVEVSGLAEVAAEAETFIARVSLNNNGEAGKLSLVGVYVEYEFDNVVG